MSRVSRIAYRYGEYLGARQAKADKMAEESMRKAEERQAGMEQRSIEAETYRRGRQEAMDAENKKRYEEEKAYREQSLASAREAAKGQAMAEAEEKTYRRGREALEYGLKARKLNQEIADREEAKAKSKFETAKTDYVKQLTDAHIDKMEAEGFFNLLGNIDAGDEKKWLDIYNKEGQHRYKDVTVDKQTGDVIFYHEPDATGKVPTPTIMKRHEIEGAFEKRNAVLSERERVAKELDVYGKKKAIEERSRARADVLSGIEADIATENARLKDLNRQLASAKRRSDKQRLEAAINEGLAKIKEYKDKRDNYNASRIAEERAGSAAPPVDNSLAGAMDNLPDF